MVIFTLPGITWLLFTPFTVTLPVLIKNGHRNSVSESTVPMAVTDYFYSINQANTLS